MRCIYEKVLLLVFVFTFSSACAFGEERTIPIASYWIDVHLDVEGKKLKANQKISFLNTSGKCVDTLFLHLYPNAFASDSTILMTESFFPERVKKDQKFRGYLSIDRVATTSGLDLTGNEIIDETIMKLPLPHALPPLGRVDLEIEFELKLPEIFLRMGYSGDDFMIGQWFPKMAVLEEDGTWNAHQYHFNSEFFADFGDYEVSITLPPDYVVAATGYLADERENGDSTKTLLFRADEVHDFAWAASPDYRIATRKIDGIQVKYFHKPEHSEVADRIMDCAEFALSYYGSAFGKYHYDHFTMVDAKVGRGRGAMEYPTLITVRPSAIPAEKVRLDAMVVFHETAHQWWYGMVANNEFEEAWLDEAFAEYSQRRALEKRFGNEGNVVDLWGIKLGELQLTKLGYLLDPETDPILTRSWEFRDYLSYRSSVYLKASLVLETLRNYLGGDSMDQLLQEYFRRYKFKHPRTRDFIELVNYFTDGDFSSRFEQLLLGTGVCDYEVKNIKSSLDNQEGRTAQYATEVELARVGEVILPVEVLIELENGEKIRRSWDGQNRWHKIEIITDSAIKSATIDPENEIVLDVNVNNNSRSLKSSDSVMMKLGGECLFWLENLMGWLTCF